LDVLLQAVVTAFPTETSSVVCRRQTYNNTASRQSYHNISLLLTEQH